MHRLAFALAFASACTLEALPTHDAAMSGNDTGVDGTVSDVASDMFVTDNGTDTPSTDVLVDAPVCRVSSLMCPSTPSVATAGCMYGRCNSASDCGTLGAPWGCATPDGMNSIVPGIGIPGGMCSRSCGSDSDCPCGGLCIYVHGHDGSMEFMCQPPCTSTSQCLPGWTCNSDTNTPPDQWCAPECAGSGDCPAGMQCDSLLGTCY